MSSAFAAPLMAGIPVTQRGASESMLVCTGVGRGGRAVSLPPYERSRTLVVLMGVARIAAVVEALTKHSGGAYPRHLPIGVVERASSPDQRLVASTLDGIVEALERAGEQRPPGMMVIGWSVLSLEGEGDVTVLDGVQGMTDEERDEADGKRIERWLGDRKWIVKEGLGEEWAGFLDEAQ